MPITDLPNLGANGGELIPLPINHAFCYWVDPAQCQYVDGVAVHLPVRVAVEPGVLGTPTNADPAHIESYQRRENGRVKVPLDFDVIAWGKKSKGYVEAMDLGRDRLGNRHLHYHEVWARYVKVGKQWIREWDHEGYLDFCQRVAKLPGVGAIHPQVAAGEKAKILRSAAVHRGQAHQSAVAASVAEQLEKKVAAPAS